MAKLHDHINTVFVGQEKVRLSQRFKTLCGKGRINSTVIGLIEKYVYDFDVAQAGDAHERTEPRTKAA
jgi:hypothetical protein